MVTMRHIDELRNVANDLIPRKHTETSYSEIINLELRYEATYAQIDAALKEYHSYADTAARRAMEDAA